MSDADADLAPRAHRRRAQRAAPPSASISTGRSACRSAPIATSTATCGMRRIDEARFVRAFAAEIAATAARTGGRTVSTIFFGGGTPSLMRPRPSPRSSTRSGSTGPSRRTPRSRSKPIRPASRRRASAAIRAAGVNRVSLGVQALDDAVAEGSSAACTPRREALDAVAIARAMFERYSFDLIYARPARRPRRGAPSSPARIDEAAEHLSLYQLTIEAGHAVRRAACGRQARHPGRRSRRARSTT